MQRLSGERGAVAVLVALLMVPLLGFTAIAVDFGATAAERQQLQIGADAAALAIAQDCAHNDCGTPALTAQSVAVANSNDGEATATVTNPALSPSTGQVTVQNEGVREHWFAPILGIDETHITTRATATWGAVSGGTAVLPLAFSFCEWLAQTDGGIPSGTDERTIFFTKTSGTTCTGPSGNVVPGGFGWLSVDSGTCHSTASINKIVMSSPGVAVPSSCSTADFAALQNQTVLLPIFDQVGATGGNAWYRLYGYAAFVITGYHFVGQYDWSAEGSCKGNKRCIQGYFTEFVDLDSAFTYGAGAPNLGAAGVRLTG